MSTSLRLLVECQSRGLLSKEAAAKVLDSRDRIIRSALRKQAAVFFDSLLRAPVVKEAGILDALGMARKAAPPASPSFLSKLLTGGATPTAAGRTAPGWSDVGVNLAKMMALAGLTAGASQGVGAIMRHSRDKAMGREVASSYERMFDELPELKETEEQHPGAVQRNFGILAKFAPSLAAVPSVAATWVQNATTMGSISTDAIKGLAETQRRIDESTESRHRGPTLAPMKVTELATKAMLT